MRGLLTLFVTLTVAPVVVLVAICWGIVIWFSRGGPDPIFAMWRVLLYFRDRYTVGWFNPTWLAGAIQRVEDYRLQSKGWSRHIPPKWLGRRIYDRYSDALFGPESAISAGVITLPILVYALVEVVKLPAVLQATGDGGRWLASALIRMRNLRSGMSWWAWISAAFFCGLVGYSLDKLRNAAVRAYCRRSFLDILDHFRGARQGLISLIPQCVPAGWAPYDVLDSREAKRVARQVLTIEDVDGPPLEVVAPPRTAYLSDGETAQLRVFAFTPTSEGKAQGKELLAGSYCLPNVLSIQNVVLDRPLDEVDVWSKFTLLHELGHLRGAGLHALLASEVAPRHAAVVVLTLWSFHPLTGLTGLPRAFLVIVPCVYFLSLGFKWFMWDRSGYTELCADLYAFAHMKQHEIGAAYDLRCETLDNIRSPVEPVALLARFTALMRRLALWWLHLRCGEDPARWRRISSHRPLQLRLPALLLSIWCMFVTFIGTVGFPSVLAAWMLAFWLHGRERQEVKVLFALNEEFGALTSHTSHCPPENR